MYLKSKEIIYEKALTAALDILNEGDRAQVLALIAESLIAEGKLVEGGKIFTKALTVIKKIDNDRVFKVEALTIVVESIGNSKEFSLKEALYKKIFNVGQGITNKSLQHAALSAIISSYARSGKLKEALESVDSIEEGWFRAVSLVAIVKELAAAGEIEEALSVVKRIEKVHISRVSALLIIAEALSKQNDSVWSKKLYEKALLLSQKIGDSSDKASAWLEIANSLAVNGDLAQALDVAENIHEPLYRVRALVSIAKIFNAKKNIDKSKSLYEQAIYVAGNMENILFKSRALLEISEALADNEDFEGALDLVKVIEDNYCQAEALVSISKHLADDGEFDRALSISRGIEEDLFRSSGLFAVAEALAYSGNFKKALAVREEIDDEYCKEQVSVALAKAFCGMGNFKKALAVAEKIKDKGCQAEAFLAIAREFKN